MAANLVGFVIGTDGVRYFVKQLVGTKEGTTHLLLDSLHLLTLFRSSISCMCGGRNVCRRAGYV